MLLFPVNNYGLFSGTSAASINVFIERHTSLVLSCRSNSSVHLNQNSGIKMLSIKVHYFNKLQIIAAIVVLCTGCPISVCFAVLDRYSKNVNVLQDQKQKQFLKIVKILIFQTLI